MNTAAGASLSFAGLLRSVCQRTPDKVAAEDAQVSRTYRQLLRRSEQIASLLLGRLGRRRGERLAIVAGNSVAYLEVVFGAALAGCPLATVNPRLSAREINAIVDDCGAALVFVDGQNRTRAQSLQAPCQVLDAAFEQQLAAVEAAPVLPPPDEHQLFTIPYTSGTTGKPKGVMISHRSRWLTVAAMQIEYGCFGPDDRFVALAPLCHGAGLVFALAPLCLGGYVRIVAGFDALQTLQTLRDTKATGVFMVPTHFAALFALPEQQLAAQRPAQLKTIISNAAPLPQPLKEKIVAYFGAGLLHETYGSTEGGIVTNLRPPDQLRKRRCVGRPIVATEISIRDEQGRECEADTVGELYSRSPYLFDGYWNNAAGTAAARRDGWVSVGDLARRDSEGYIYIVDRKKDMVISGGVNIYPSEVEQVIAEHPAVAEVAVVGVPDAKWGEALKAFVVPAPGSDPPDSDELLAFCGARLSRFKIPRQIQAIEAIPKNPTGKVLKAALRSLGNTEQGS